MTRYFARSINSLVFLTVEGQRDFDGLTLIGYEALRRVLIPDICHRPLTQSPPMPKSELASSLSAYSARSAKVVLQHKSKVVAPVQKACHFCPNWRVPRWHVQR